MLVKIKDFLMIGHFKVALAFGLQVGLAHDVERIGTMCKAAVIRNLGSSVEISSAA